MTTANKITILRILLIPFFVVEVLYYVKNGDEVRAWQAEFEHGVNLYLAKDYTMAVVHFNSQINFWEHQPRTDEAAAWIKKSYEWCTKAEKAEAEHAGKETTSSGSISTDITREPTEESIGAPGSLANPNMRVRSYRSGPVFNWTSTGERQKK